MRVALAGVAEAPLRYRAVEGEVRRALLARFPYALFFVADPDRTPVLACLHGHRDPAARPGSSDAPEV